MPYIVKWQRVFRPTVLSWASTFSDPYATNTQLSESVVLKMWDIIYPKVMLGLEERKDAGRILVYLVSHYVLFRMQFTSVSRPETFCMIGVPQSVQVH
jgi:hypothetical protein